MAEQAEARSDVQVLTPENAEAFYADRLGLEPAQAVESATESEAEQPEQRDERGRFRPGRVRDLTKDKDQAEEAAKATATELQETRNSLAQTQAERDALRAKYEPPKPDELGPEPKRAEFQNDDEFIASLKIWTRESALKEDQARREAERINEDWTGRLKTTREKMEDFDDVVGKSTAQVPQHIRDEIVKSDVGPELLYHLAKHPDEAQKFASMSVGAGLKAFGRLEARFEAKPESVKVSDVAKAAPEISRAPAPIVPLKGGNTGLDIPVDSKGNWSGSHDQYVRLRREGKI